MNIIVCIKQVPSTNEVRLDPVTGVMLREGVHGIMNPFDAYALEEALRLREKQGGTVTVLSMGNGSAAGTLKDAVAAGADRAVLLCDVKFAGSDTLATSRALAAGIRKLGGADLILFGKAASDGDTGQTGVMTARELGISHCGDAAGIERITYSDEDGNNTCRSTGYMVVRSMTDRGYRLAEVRLPAAVSVTKEINIPRLPSLTGILKGRDAEIEILTAEDIGIDPSYTGLKGSPTRVIKTFRPEQKGECVMKENVDEFLDIILGGDDDEA